MQRARRPPPTPRSWSPLHPRPAAPASCRTSPRCRPNAPRTPHTGWCRSRHAVPVKPSLIRRNNSTRRVRPSSTVCGVPFTDQHYLRHASAPLRSCRDRSLSVGLPSWCGQARKGTQGFAPDHKRGFAPWTLHQRRSLWDPFILVGLKRRGPPLPSACLRSIAPGTPTATQAPLPSTPNQLDGFQAAPPLAGIQGAEPGGRSGAKSASQRARANTTRISNSRLTARNASNGAST